MIAQSKAPSHDPCSGQHVIPCTIPPTDRVLDACGMLGVRVRLHHRDSHTNPSDTKSRLAHIAAQFATELAESACSVQRSAAPGTIAYITGPSGSGKSTVLRMLAASPEFAAGGTRVIIAETGNLPDRSLPDLFHGPLERALYWLSRVGLAEASLLTRRPAELSEGQRWRLALGVSLASAGPRGWVLADEFGSLLDRFTSRAVATSISKCVRLTGRRLIAATAHDDLEPTLAPHHTLRLTIDHRDEGNEP